MLAASYTYTNDGLVSTRTDGNGVVTNYSYDALNRAVGEAHSGSAVSSRITRCYDGKVSNGDGSANCQNPPTAMLLAHGRLTESRSNLAAVGVVSLSRNSQFDELGRMGASQQTTNGGPAYQFRYRYDLAGEPTVVTTPSGRTLTTVYNYLEQPVSVTGAIGGGAATLYAGGAVYGASGALASMNVNSGLESWTYNSRLQATGVKGAAGFSLGLDYGGSANNGNLLSQTIGRGVSGWNQGFAYDGVNRLCAAAEGTGAVAMSGCAAPVSGVNWSQSYGYDRYGNRWVSASTGYGLGTYTAAAASNFDGGNHLAIAGVAHDSAGNQTQMGTGLAMSYDADGRMAGSTLNGTATSYVYDADGRRVLKQTGSVATVYVYDAFGQLALEAGGIPETACTTCFVTVDQLGSTRQTVSGLGVATGCHDYLPFGEELNGVGGRSGGCWGTGDTTLKFTGKQRDSETVSSGMATGLDYFGFRYMSSAQGRFTSPDEPFAGWDQHNPQTFNLYTYGQNNPLKYTDPDGHDVQICVPGSDCFNVSDAQYRSLYKQQNGQQGIGLPGGTFPGGNITCGGQNCGTARYFEPSMTDDTINLAITFDGARGFFAGGKALFSGVRNLFARDAAEEGGVVIGKQVHLDTPGSVGAGERQLDLPNLNDPKANCAQNSGRLREAMSEGKPIRDVSAEPLVNGRPGNNTGFLRAERNLLENHGWTLRDGYWTPPAK